MSNKIVRLLCAVCGKATRGRQWFNRDRGYGICRKCAAFVRARTSAELLRESFGDAGVHYNVEES